MITITKFSLVLLVIDYNETIIITQGPSDNYVSFQITVVKNQRWQAWSDKGQN